MRPHRVRRLISPKSDTCTEGAGVNVAGISVKVTRITEQVRNFNQTLRGHYAYYGVAGNFQSLHKVYQRTESYWHKMLCSRSRAGYIPWPVFHRIRERLLLLRPKLLLPYPKLKALAVL